MGDRAIIVIKNKNNEYSPCCCYLHWNGTECLDWLESAIPRMRVNDIDYSMARLIGEMHNKISGNLGLGVISMKLDVESWEKFSHGDFGVVIYDCDTGKIECYGGYGTKDRRNGKNIGIPPG